MDLYATFHFISCWIVLMLLLTFIIFFQISISFTPAVGAHKDGHDDASVSDTSSDTVT